jgi:predicted ATP-binding protein involved in virulence
MAQDPIIVVVAVEGLHDQFDFEITLQPGLNVLYGKNGRGKTTLLHLLANLLELDFQRFSYLQFRKISILNSRGDVVELQKYEPGSSPKVSLNGSTTSFSGLNSSLSEVETATLREVLGARPTYLPAFRSILERTRSDSAPYFRASERREPEYELMVERELSVLREAYEKGEPNPYALRQLQDEALSIVERTILCRQWFGKFVPVVRYPSVADVEDALTEEWRRAQAVINIREQRMFEQTFVKVFRAIAGIEETRTAENNENLLISISELLNDQESQLARTESSQIYNSLLEAARLVGSNTAQFGGINNSLLEIYRQVLEARNTERRNAFQRSRDFESSINRFLDKKSLRIGRLPGLTRTRSMVAVTTDGGQSYNLSALSSGERQILTMLYSASRSKFLSGIFLIDEPELSLHIDWQRIILRELKNQSPDRQIIACTHSPEVGADHLVEIQDFEPKHSPKIQESVFLEEEE